MMRKTVILLTILLTACGESGHAPDAAHPAPTAAPKPGAKGKMFEDVRRQLDEVEAGVAEYLRANDAI